MHRRNFFKTSALGGSALAIAGVAGCHSHNNERSASEIHIDPRFELNEETILGLQSKMEKGILTAEALTQKYLDRIAAIDPFLNSMLEINPDALSIARRLDVERKSGNVRGPLHGIPIVIKDNIDTADKMSTTAGSLALEGHIAAEDAQIVARLREAGAVLLGKTNLSEWANFRSTRSSSGWSGRGGQVRNPYALDRSPCGSSSGTGAAIAGNLCAIGIGTETNGSIVCPSGINGLVGVKPTLGLWSRRGIIPIAHSQDTAGPMCRTVTDAAVLLGALAGFDDQDAETHIAPGEIFSDYTQFLKQTDLSGLRIGVAREMLGFNNQIDALFDEALDQLRSLGAIIVDPVSFATRRQWGAPSYEVLLYEFKADLNAYLAAHPSAPVQSLADIIAFNQANAEKEMPWFGQEIMEAAEAKGDLSSAEYIEALRSSKKYSREEGIDAVMETYNLDAIVAGTNGLAWSIDWVNGDNFSGSSSSPAAISGYPNITVPMGQVHGLPAGISFFGSAWSEPKLLQIAYAYEQASAKRVAPSFRSSLMA